MGVNIKKWGGVVVLTALMSSVASVALAEEKESELPPLRESSIPEVLDLNTKLNSFYDQAFTTGDAKFLFNLSNEDLKIIRDSRRIQALYEDLLEQQDRDHPTVRTRDLPNPYDTSVFELQGL